MNLFRVVSLLSFFGLTLTGLASAEDAAAAKGQGPVRISVTRFYDPNYPELPETRRLLELVKEEPRLELEQWGGELNFPAIL